MADALLVDGVDFPPDGTLEWPHDDHYAGAEARGEAVEYPGLDGGELGDPAYPARVWSAPVALYPPDDTTPGMAGANQRFRDLRAACKPGRDVTLTRRMTFPGSVTEDHTARARFVNAAAARVSAEVTRAVCEFVLLDGLWYGPEVVAAAPATITVGGDVRTHRMVVTLTGAALTLTNTTTGTVLSYSGDASGGVSVDVEALTVTGGSAALLSWNQRLPFRLEPGPNTLTVSGGTASIAYRPAYL